MAARGTIFKILDDLERTVARCQDCRLALTRNKTVFGAGNPEAELVVFGEGPGEEEDQEGVPFVGRSGKLQARMLQTIGFDRTNTYILNVVKCLRGTSRVELGDGSMERIEKLVKDRFSGLVPSVNSSGRRVLRPVIGWHRTPLANRKLFALSYFGLVARGKGPYSSGTVITEDHPILTRRGYVSAAEVQLSDEVCTGTPGLSDKQLAAAYGTLLGDAGVTERTFYFRHSKKQEEYTRLKARLFSNLGDGWDSGKLDSGYEYVGWRSKRCPVAEDLRGIFYTNDRKRLPEILSPFGDRKISRVGSLSRWTMALWYLDDGYFSKDGLCEIAFNNFSLEEGDRMVRYLQDQGFRGASLRNAESYTGVRIAFDREATGLLCNFIAPLVPESMQYKIAPSAQGRFDRAQYEPDEELYWSYPLLEHVEPRKGENWVYCLDVEDTHNFITTGGVVHNCRACEEAIDDKGKPIPYYNQRGRGGMRNRAPEMDEIKACRHFTDAQLKALPNKRLIICMGSVPAHWLLWDERTEKKLAMNGMRGKTFATIHGPAIVTYHPSYLLRSPHEKIKSYVDFRRAEKFLKEKRTEDELIEMLSHPALARERTQTYTALQSTRRRGSLKPFQNDPYSTTLKVI